MGSYLQMLAGQGKQGTSADVPRANVDIRWAGMSQSGVAGLDRVDQTRGKATGVGVPPSAVAPRPFSDVAPFGIRPPSRQRDVVGVNPGSATGAGDVLSGAMAIGYGAPSLRVRDRAPASWDPHFEQLTERGVPLAASALAVVHGVRISYVAARQPGQMPPTMAQAGMAAADVRVQRRSGSGFVDVARGSAVAPGEAIRLSASGLAPFDGVQFRVTGAAGEAFNGGVTGNATGNAWVDLVAPLAEGSYSVVLTVPGLFGVGHRQYSTTFSVAAGAPKPPAPPPSNNPFDDLKGIGTLVLIGIGLIVAKPVIAGLAKK